jgi:hypothetical protein
MVKRNMNSRVGQNRGIKTMVRQMIDAKKEHKLYAAATAYTNTEAGVITEMTRGIVLGDGLNSRDGDVIAPKKIVLNYTLRGQADSTSTHRIVIVQDVMNRGAVPSTTDILTSASVVSAFNIVNEQQGRFKVLYDRIHSVVLAGNSANTHVQRTIPLKGLIHYQATAGDATDNGKNSVFMLTCCTPVTTSTANVAAGWTVHFTDS